MTTEEAITGYGPVDQRKDGQEPAGGMRELSTLRLKKEK